MNLLADPNYIRAWPGGCGFAKMGSNYAPTLWIGEAAAKLNCQQVCRAATETVNYNTTYIYVFILSLI